MNKVLITGRVVKDLELYKTSSGKSRLSFTVAVDRKITKEAKEEGKKSADFINCEVWEQLAELMVKYCSKGSKIALEGRLEERTYDKQDGTKGYLTYVRVQNIEFLDSKPKETNDNSVQVKEENPFEEFGKSVDLSDVTLDDSDLPF